MPAAVALSRHRVHTAQASYEPKTMRIAAIAHAVPSLIVDNDEAIRRLREHNADRFPVAELDRFESQIRAQWRVSGTAERHVSAPDEPALGFAISASQQALNEAGLEAADLDLIVYSGIGRGWLEPATAPSIQHAIGAANATSFDVLDACAGWVRGLDLVSALLPARHWRHAMIVNCEIGMDRYAALDLPSAADPESGFAALTVGEAATATIVTHAPDSDYHSVFRTFAEHFDLCMIPLENAYRFAVPPLAPTRAPGRFFVASNQLIAFAVRRISDLYRAEPLFSEDSYSIVFTHAASSRSTEMLLRSFGLPLELGYDIHPRFGNVSSASVPLAMSLAAREGRLQRGQKILLAIGSAGVTIAFASFTF